MRWWVLALVCGCSSGVNRLYGEVHVHEFPEGVHPAALFIQDALPAARASGESIFGSDGPPLGQCDSGLADGPPATLQVVDAGLVQIVGTTNTLTLRFDSEVRGYLPEGAVTPFSGGEWLQVSAQGAEAGAFSGALLTPQPLSLIAPFALSHIDGDLPVTWTPGSATRVSTILVGSTSDGSWGAVRCNASDSAGSLTMPASLLAQLPPPPRDLQLQVSRDQITRVPGSPDGDGVVLHAAYQVTLTGQER